MEKDKFISSAKWADFKKNVLANQPAKKSVKLNEIDIISESVVQFKENKAQVPMSPAAQRDLREILGLPKKFTNDLTKSFGEEVRQKITLICKVMASQTKKVPTLTFILDIKARQIMRIFEDDKMLTAESFFDMFENVVGDHKLNLKDYGMSMDGGVFMSVVSEDSEFQVGKFSDEIFHPGMTFKNNSQDGAYVSPFMFRLVCTNGMQNPSFGGPDSGPTDGGSGDKNGRGPINLDGSDFKSLDLFYKHIDHFVRGGFFPQKFINKITTAKETKASLNEVEAAASLILNNSKAKVEQISRFVPLTEINSEYKRLGADPKFLSNQQKSNTRTNVTVWQLINGVTDFASHDYGFEVPAHDRLRMQVGAGGLLDKGKFDTQNLMNVHLS